MPAQHLITQVVAEVQMAFTDSNAQLVLDCVNRVHRDLCAEFSLFKDTVVISLTAGTREYALDKDVMKIRQATYFPDSSGSYQILSAIDVSEMDREHAAWRQWANSTPKGYYIDAGYIGFFPAPSVTTSAGYPNVTIETTEATTLAMSDSIPTSIRSSRVYVQGARRYYAEYAAPDKVQFYDTLYQQEIGDMERSMGRRNSQYRSKITPGGPLAASQV